MSHEPSNAQEPAQPILDSTPGSTLAGRIPAKLTIPDIDSQLPFDGTVDVNRAASELAKAEADERLRWDGWWLAKERLDAAKRALAEAVNIRAKALAKTTEVRAF